MDGPRFDSLARTLTAAGSRRLVLGSFSGVALGVLDSVVTLPRIEDKKRHNKGNAKKHDGKKGKNGPTCEPCAACPTGANCPTCPECETCPTCETCPNCPACETCPEPVATPTCKQRCGACDFCLTQTDGPYLCGEVGSYPWEYSCDQPVCTSNNDCVGTDRPYCLTRVSAYNRNSGDFSDAGSVCPDGGARCVKINHPCAA